MAFVGFDLDETIGRFETLSGAYTKFLDPEKAYFRSSGSGLYGSTLAQRTVPLTPELASLFDKAVEIFTEKLCEYEKAGTLGLLRPSIIPIAQRLSKLKQSGQVKSVVIYSNNGNYMALEVAAKMVEKIAGIPKLFDMLIHRYHPIRQYTLEQSTGGFFKTIPTLFIANSYLNKEHLTFGEFAKKLYFFDDQNHALLSNYLENRYIMNPAYKFTGDSRLVLEAFEKAFTESGLSENAYYYQFINTPKLLSSPNNNKESVLYVARNQQQYSTLVTTKPDNSAFMTTFNQMFPDIQPPVAKNLFRNAMQTFRNLEGRLNKGEELSLDDLATLEKSKRIIAAYETQNPEQQGGKRKKTRKRKTRGKRKH